MWNASGIARSIADAADYGFDVASGGGDWAVLKGKRDALVLHLNARKIATRLLFGGNLLRQPYMLGRAHNVPGPLDGADLVMNSTFWIGVFPGLGDGHIDYMAEEMTGFCRAA